ncbi:MAG: radical SAM protein [Candidatus Omnitrophota bacterium]
MQTNANGMNVLLIAPPVENKVKYFQGWQLSVSDYGSFPPLGLLYIATVLKQNMPEANIKLIDSLPEKRDYPEIEGIIRNFKPDIVGVSAFSVCLVDVLKVARLAKQINSHIHVCIGGPHLSIYPQQTLRQPEVDSIVIGEGEDVFLELARQIKEGKLKQGINGLYFKPDLNKGNFQKADAVDLDKLPFFSLDFIRRDIYFSTVGRQRNIITLLSSRGCPYRCAFCDVPYKNFRERKIDNILEEIKLRLRQGYREIFFYDDTFNMTSQRVIALSQRIIDARLDFEWSFRGRVNTLTYDMLKIARRASCRRIHFGIETATNEGLAEIKKGITIEQVRDALAWCRRLKIKTIGDFIIGLPFEKSRKDVVGNIGRFMEFAPDYGQFNFLQPLPGTEIYESGIQQGIIDPQGWEDFARSPSADFQPPLWTQYLSKADLAELLYYAYRRYYIRPGYILASLASLRTASEFRRVIKGGLKILFKC